MRIKTGTFAMLIVHDDDEVDVAVLVEVADGERPLQVGAHERIAERSANVVHENSEDGVELRIGCGSEHIRWQRGELPRAPW